MKVSTLFSLLFIATPALAAPKYSLEAIQCNFSNGVTLQGTEKGGQFARDAMTVSTQWGFLSREGVIRGWGTGITNRKEYNAEFMLEMNKPGQPERDTFFLFLNLDLASAAPQKATGILMGQGAEWKVADATCTVEMPPVK